MLCLFVFCLFVVCQSFHVWMARRTEYHLYDWVRRKFDFVVRLLLVILRINRNITLWSKTGGKIGKHKSAGYPLWW